MTRTVVPPSTVAFPGLPGLLAFACLSALLLLPSTDAGAGPDQPECMWRLLPNSPGNSSGSRIEDVAFATPTIGWCVELSGRIHGTVDGGFTWGLGYDAPDSARFRCVGTSDARTAWAGAILAHPEASPLFRTTDGGAHWQSVPVPLPPGTGLCGMSTVSDAVYAVGRYTGPAVLLRSRDRGATWDYVDMSGYADGLVDCHFFTPDSGLVVGSKGTFGANNRAIILMTGDGGDTFQVVHFGTSFKEQCWKITFPTRQTGYVSIQSFGSPARYLRTADGGKTWFQEMFPGTPSDMQGIGFVTPSTGWIGGYSELRQTSDAGVNWVNAPFGTNMNRFRFLADTLGYAAGARIYRYSPSPATPVGLSGLSARRLDDTAVVTWLVPQESSRTLFHVHRSTDGGMRTRRTAAALSGRTRYEFREAAPVENAVDYWLEEIAPSGATKWIGPIPLEEKTRPPHAYLESVWPNPFRTETSIAVDLMEEMDVRVSVHDVSGRRVARIADERLPGGRTILRWDGRSEDGRPVAAGMYLLKIEAGGRTDSWKVFRTAAGG